MPVSHGDIRRVIEKRAEEPITFRDPMQLATPIADIAIGERLTSGLARPNSAAQGRVEGRERAGETLSAKKLCYCGGRPSGSLAPLGLPRSSFGIGMAPKLRS